MLLLKIFIATILLLIVIYDFAFFKIPNWTIILLLALGITKNYNDIIPYIISAFVVFALYFFIWKVIKGMGFGDVKLAGTLALIFGFEQFMLFALAGTILSLIYALLLCKQKIAYGAFIAVGGIVGIFFLPF